MKGHLYHLRKVPTGTLMASAPGYAAAQRVATSLAKRIRDERRILVDQKRRHEETGNPSARQIQMLEDVVDLKSEAIKIVNTKTGVEIRVPIYPDDDVDVDDQDDDDHPKTDTPQEALQP